MLDPEGALNRFSRRTCLKGGLTLASFLAAGAEQARALAPRGPLPADDPFWLAVQSGFPIDRSIANFNAAAVYPASEASMRALESYNRQMNQVPVDTLWELWRRREGIRQSLSTLVSAPSECVALTRNATEALNIVQLGLPMKAGDEVVTTNHDYWSVFNAFRQREQRDGIKTRVVDIPFPSEVPETLVDLIAAKMNAKTRLVVISHVNFTTGQIMPVREICAMATAKGVPVLVDGAHALGQIDVRISDLGCTFYAANLHKWLMAPVGCGMLYIRNDWIERVWPHSPTWPGQERDIRKYEEVGTVSPTAWLAAGEAIQFQSALGAPAKEARLRHLRGKWLDPIRNLPGVKLHTSLDPRFSCGMAAVQIRDLDGVEIYKFLYDKYQVRIVDMVWPPPPEKAYINAIRISVGLHNSEDDFARLADGLDHVIRKGLTR